MAADQKLFDTMVSAVAAEDLAQDNAVNEAGTSFPCGVTATILTSNLGC